MAKAVEFADPPIPGAYLDFQRLPKLVIKDALYFEHRDERYEDTLRPHLFGKPHLEIRAIDGNSMFRETCLEAFVNTVYWSGLQWPVQMNCVVLLNAPNTTRTVDGRSVGGRHCDVWWFGHDRHSLYSVVPATQGFQSRWPPRDDDVYRGSPVGVARGVFPLVPAGVRELLPKSLLHEILASRSADHMSEREHRLLRYIHVPTEPPERSVRAMFIREGEEDTERSWEVDSEDSGVSEADYEECWDLSEIGDDTRGLWRWVHCLGLAKPMLVRERYREESPSYLDFTEPLVNLVRLRDMGIDTKQEPCKILNECLDVILDCCPPLWKEEAKRGVIVCPISRKILVTGKSCHHILRAIPLSLRTVLGLTDSSGIDFPCKWGVNMASGPGRLVVWRTPDEKVEVAPPRKYQVKNTQHSRHVRDALGVGHVKSLTWADLKMYEVLGLARASRGEEGGEKGTPCRLPSEDKDARNARCAASSEASCEERSAESNERESSALEAVRVANECARMEKERRKQATVARPRKYEASKRRGGKDERNKQCLEASAEKTEKAASVRKSPAPAVDVPSKCRATDEDLDALLQASEQGRAPAHMFRCVGRRMKKALLKEKRLESQRRVEELFF